jgi:hypothetical protein
MAWRPPGGGTRRLTGSRELMQKRQRVVPAAQIRVAAIAQEIVGID